MQVACDLYALSLFPSLCSYAIFVNALTKRNSALIILRVAGSCSLLEEIRHGSICFFKKSLLIDVVILIYL